MTNILFLIDTLEAGGAEKVLRTLVNNMDQTRFTITVVTAFPEKAEKFLVPGIAYRSLYPKKNKLYRLLLRVEAQLGLTYRLRIRGENDIEVAYLECAPTKIMAGSTNKKALKIAWVHCDLEKKTSDVQRFVAKSRPWYRKYHKIVCVSQNVRDSFERMYGKEFDTVVLHNANDEEEIQSKAIAFSLPKADTKTLVAVGRLSWQKGFDRLIQAVALLKKQGNVFGLKILGEGPERESLKDLIQKEDVEDCVELLGFQSNPYPYLQEADAVVCSSRYEGFSTVVTEALILGKAIVTTPCTGMDELLSDSQYGLITPDSVEGLASGICRILDEDTKRAYEVAAKIRAKAFSLKAVLSQTEKFFLNSLKAKIDKE